MENLYEKGGLKAMIVSGNADYIIDETSNKANASSDDETNQTTESKKRKEREGSSSEPPTDGEDDSHVQKKKRVIWTSEMHQKFVDAITQIGQDSKLSYYNCFIHFFTELSRAFPKKIVEVMNEPGLTRENVASHLQKYRICLKKSQEVMDKYRQELNTVTNNAKAPYIYDTSLRNFQEHYLGSSHQLASRNYLSISSSSNSSIYGIRTSIGASRVRLAPPSYSSFDVSSLRISTGNVQNQYNRTTGVNKSFRAYSDEERNMLLSILNKRPSSTSDDHATSTSISNSAFLGLRIASDGKSLLFGGSDRSKIVSSDNYSTKRNDFHCQDSVSPLFPSFDVENYVQGSPLPQLPEFYTENHLEEPSLPPLPELYVESSLPQLETAENDPFNFIPQQETYYGTNQTEDINSFSTGHTGTSLEQQNYLQTLPWETLESAEMEMISQILANNHTDTVTSLPPITSPWYPNLNTNSYPLINQEDSLPPLPSEIPWNLYPDSTTSNPVPQVMNQQSLLPPLPSESQWNVNSDASTLPASNNFLDQQNFLPPLPSEIPWSLDSDLVPPAYNDDFFNGQNIVSPTETPEASVQQLSSFYANMW